MWKLDLSFHPACFSHEEVSYAFSSLCIVTFMSNSIEMGQTVYGGSDITLTTSTRKRL